MPCLDFIVFNIKTSIKNKYVKNALIEKDAPVILPLYGWPPENK